ncbi:MAG TPA: hypothetical protein VJS44_00505 [Pyrinomonadaceae bacterium]|nr:hypothetical protein [Pyrinomonadaceae bacterium]
MKRTLALTLSIAALLIAGDALTGSTTRGLSLKQNRQECVQACQRDNRDRVKECNTYYPPDSQPVKHRECLDKARTKFDACLATCQ